MMKQASLFRAFSVPALAFALMSCAEGVQPTQVDVPDAAQLTHGTGPALLECPTDVTKSTSKTIDLLGGTLELDGHKVVIPANAVLIPTTFTLEVPAGNYMKIHVNAAGHAHYQFEKPVSLTISYARCTRSNIEKHNLVISHVDEVTNAILANMGGTDDKTARTVTTGTDHLSGYVITTP